MTTEEVQIHSSDISHVTQLSKNYSVQLMLNVAHAAFLIIVAIILCFFPRVSVTILSLSWIRSAFSVPYLLLCVFVLRHNSSVRVIIRLRARRLRSLGSISGRARGFSFLQNAYNVCLGPPSLLFKRHRDIFPQG